MNVPDSACARLTAGVGQSGAGSVGGATVYRVFVVCVFVCLFRYSDVLLASFCMNVYVLCSVGVVCISFWASGAPSLSGVRGQGHTAHWSLRDGQTGETVVLQAGRCNLALRTHAPEAK